MTPDRVSPGPAPVVVIGAGPAGLGAGWELARCGQRPLILEAGPRLGGIARTEPFRGFYFDIGGHRFLTRVAEIQALWESTLGSDLLLVRRLSRIYYQGRFFSYPLHFGNALFTLGPLESARIVASYLKAQAFPTDQEESFEQWVSNRFGRRLYRIFFKTYTEKVWGIPCDRLRAEWAAQRIMGLSLVAVVANALFGTRNAKTLADQFYYPRRGPGMMWEALGREVTHRGGRVQMASPVVRLEHAAGRIRTVSLHRCGRDESIRPAAVIATLPINRLVQILDPPPPAAVLQAAAGLFHRALVLVGLIIADQRMFPDQWIYVHSPQVRVGRIQNFKNWSAGMCPDPAWMNIGMEYFCEAGDRLWSMPDAELVALAARELAELGLAPDAAVRDGFVVRQPDAYPVYDEHYAAHLDVLRAFLGGFENLQTVGRNGMHRYNNMDHAMQTGILAARNVLGQRHDLWAVNTDRQHLESATVEDHRHLDPEWVITQTFARMDKGAFGTAVGTVAALGFFLATAWLLVKGGPVVGPNLRLLSQYFIGYTVSWPGSLVAAGYGFTLGAVAGWAMAGLRNFFLAFWLFRVRKVAELKSLREFLDLL